MDVQSHLSEKLDIHFCGEIVQTQKLTLKLAATVINRN